MVKISIIMPLYNAAKYLEESLNSVLAQTFTDFELICVNDASSDATMKILQDFQKKDDRIRILSNLKRCGAAVSRNKGMKLANGKYLSFLDGDDIFDEMMLEKAYDTIEGKKADIVMYGYRHVLSDVIHNKLRICHSKEYTDRYCRNTFSVQDCEPYEFLNWTSGPWNKLYERTFIVENQLDFQDLPSANDNYFVLMALMLANKMIVVEEENLMVYVRDHLEVGRISSNRDSECVYKALMHVGKELVKRKKFDKLYACYYYRVYFSLRNALMSDKNKKRVQSFYEFLQKEGIENFCSLNRKYYDMLDEYIRKGLQLYVEKNFESGWYRDENLLRIYLYKRANKVIDLFESFRINGKKIAIWGAGRNGRILLKFCLNNKLEVETVIDRSREKQGSILERYMIASPEAVLDNIQVIITSAYAIYEDVVKEVKDKKIEVIEISQFLCIN